MKKIFIPLLFLTVVIALIFPKGSDYKFLIPYFLSLLFFFNFYAIKFEFKSVLNLELLIYVAVVLIVNPIIVYFSSFMLDYEFRIGLFLIAISPTAIASPIIIKYLKGNLEFSVTNIIVFNLLSPLSYTLLLKLFFRDSQFDISIYKIVSSLTIIVFIPFVLATVVKKITPQNRVLLKISHYAGFLFLATVYLSVSSSALELRAVEPAQLARLFAYVIGAALILYTAGFVFGKNVESKKTLAVSMGQKNTALCIWIALFNFSPLAAIPPTIYIIVHHSINTIVMLFFQQKEKRAGLSAIEKIK